MKSCALGEYEKMKRLFFLFILDFLMTACSTNSMSVYPIRASHAGNNWLAKIGDYTLSQEEFDDSFRLYMSQIPESSRATLPPEATLKMEYLNQMIREYAILIKALNSGIQNNKGTSLQFQSTMRTAICEFYLNQNIPQDPGFFMPTRAEKEEAYQQYKAELTRRGYNAEQISQILDQQLVQKKKQQWIARFVQEAKEDIKVQINEENIHALIMVTQQPGSTNH